LCVANQSTNWLSGLTAKPPRDARTLSFPHLPFAPRALLPQSPTRLALCICLFFSVLSFVMRCALFLGLYGFPQGVFETLPSFPLRPLCFAPLFSTDPSPFRLPLSRPRVFAFGSRPLSHPVPLLPSTGDSYPRCIPLQALRLTLSNHLNPHTCSFDRLS